MYVMQSMMERLRSLVGSTGWDYCVLWKLSEDQRLIEMVGCCCAGAEYNENGGEEFHFPVSQCRDDVFQHPIRTKACELLSQMPSSMPLDSRIHAQVLISYEPKWLNFTCSLDSKAEEETLGTKVLIPVPGGLIELFVTKQVPEDQRVISFITSQSTVPLEDDAFLSSAAEISFSINPNALNDIHSRPLLIETRGPKDLQAQAPESHNLPYDLSVDRNHLYDATHGGSHSSYVPNEEMINPSHNISAENGFQEMDGMQQENMELMEPLLNKEWQGDDKDPFKTETRGSKSMSDCSDQNDDDEESKGKQPSKNLHAERKRRKKLNDRLYNLRSLVPKISKLDRASILGDAIDFIMDLQKQAKDLQDELEEHSDVEDPKNSYNCNNPNTCLPEVIDIGHVPPSDKTAFRYQQAGGSRTDEFTKQNHNLDTAREKQQQMEPQVEVAQMDGNQFFVKVFGEHRAGAFARLMEALDSMGLVVTNANVTRFLSLVSNVFTVEKKDSETVQPDLLKDSLLELTRNPSSEWSGPNKAMENGGSLDCHQHHYHLIHDHLF